ncbi:MAG: hypothetical protein C0402_14105 [Thermodesulfovibrio sp.]|nr:hypothetical protein [Thermodesulfovibrio sp.]
MMKCAYTLTLLVILFPALALSAGAPKEHPIDITHAACIEKDWSTAGMANCTHKAKEQWDRELNNNYNALMKKLPPADKEVLKAAQKKWLEFRDSEYKLIRALYGKLSGTMYIPMRADMAMQIVKQRAMDLANYLELSGNSEEENSGKQ